jgi:pimeloyl-ACP methyl ester carboxylesterase
VPSSKSASRISAGLIDGHALTEIRHDHASVNGVRLHYAHAGQGPLILFLHGFPEFWYCWKKQLEDLGRDHLAVAPDLRGYNLSDRPADVKQYKARILIEDVRQLVEHLGKEKFVLVAHDWGGAVAWAYAMAHPRTLSKLVIVNAPHPVMFARELAHNPAQAAASQYMNLLRSDKAERVLSENDYERLAKMTLEGWGRGRVDPAERKVYIEAWSQQGALTGSLNYYRASPLYPPTGDDPGARALSLDPAEFVVRVPTLVVWGMRDQALLPGSLPEASHWVMHEEPERLNRLIRTFIGD